MDMSNKYCIYFGTVRGLIGNTYCKAGDLARYDLQSTNQNAEITTLEWGRNEGEIVVGQKSGIVKLYNTVTCEVSTCVTELNGAGAVVGADALEDNLIIAYKSGHVNIWNENHNDYFTLNLANDSTLERIRHNKCRSNIIATGGEANDLKLWDIETKKCVFKAKSMGHDNLNLPIPTSIRDICFIDNDGILTACCTKEGNVLVYDDRAQRRPISKFVELKASYTTIATAFKERQCFVGTTRGYMQLLDMKDPTKCIKTFKSFTGSVSSIVCDPAASVVATVSLDRYLRIHDIETKELLYKEYLKQSLTKLIMKPIIKEESKTESQDEIHGKDVSNEVDEEYEELFDNMETVSEKQTKTTKRAVADSSIKTYKISKKKKRII